MTDFQWHISMIFCCIIMQCNIQWTITIYRYTVSTLSGFDSELISGTLIYFGQKIVTSKSINWEHFDLNNLGLRILTEICTFKRLQIHTVLVSKPQTVFIYCSPRTQEIHFISLGELVQEQNETKFRFYSVDIILRHGNMTLGNPYQ